MDAGEYDTNTLLINNLSSVAYRIYEPVSHSSVYTFNASDVEHALRSDGQLVYMDSVRRGIWCFFLSTKDTSPASQAEQLGLTNMMEVCGYPLRLVHEGAFEPIQLLKNRAPGPNPINTPTSSSSSGSALDMTFRNAQPYNTPPVAVLGPGPVVTDGAVAPNPVKEGNRYTSLPIPDIHEFFITALLATLSSSFCRQIGAIPLNHRTVLLPPEAFHLGETESTEALQASALATFRIYLTTTGSLVVSLCVSVLQGLVSSADVVRGNFLSGGSIVLAAPLGAFGALQGIVDVDMHATDNAVGQSPDTQISRIKPETSDKFSQWKSTCSKMIQARGMSSSLLQNCSWLNIHFLQRRPYEQRADGKRTPLQNPAPTAPWPALLCFRKPRIGAGLDNRFEKTSLTGMMEQLDPLNNARAWHQGFSETETIIAKRKKERDLALSRNTTESDTRNTQHNGYSPMVLRRSSNGAARTASRTMYPTPPDGIQQSGIPAGFDPSVLSPGHILPVTAPPDADTTMQNEVAAGDGFDGEWDGTDVKREQPGANFLENDNMFDDIGDDLFEENELTDADFNFFDEQPPAGVDMDLSVLPEMGSAMELSTALSQPKEPQPRLPAATEPSKGTVISPQFTKPELKHARSTLAEESRQQSNMESFNANSAVGLKRYPSPFNPDTVYKRICASVYAPPPSKYSSRRIPSQRGSVFEKVDFDPSLSLAVKKYQESGPFNYTIPSLKDEENKLLEDRSPLATGNPSRTTRQRKDLKEPLSNLNLLWAKITGGFNDSPPRPDDLMSNSDDSSWDSDRDDTSQVSGGPSSPAKSSIAKRRPDDDTISMAASFKDLENTSADSPAYGSVDLVRLSRPEMPEISMTKFFTDPEPAPLRLSCTDDDFMTVAQILTEQVATGSLRFVPKSPTPETRAIRRGLVTAARYIIQGLRKALPKPLAGASECQLRPFIDVQDVPLPAPPSRVQSKDSAKPPNIFKLPAPHMEFRRYDTRISVLPPALSFWESLGLGASQGPKDIISIGVFPALDGMRDSVGAYLDRIGHVYESLKLGTFKPLPTATGIADGLLPFINDQDMSSMDSPGQSLPRGGSALTEYMMRLGQALAMSPLTEKNFVVYFIYSLDNPSTVVEYCAAFQELFEHYKRCLAERKMEILNDLVLQLVPQDHVASETSMVILSPSEYAKLCIETYDRCTLFGGPMPAPAIVLETPVPRSFEFKMAATPSPNLLQENSCVHIAYAQSVDERWITAAWTDNCGKRQITASYCLGRRNKPLTRQLTEILHEIWETTCDFISVSRVHWRVIITKCGPMDQQEMEYWVGLAQSETKATVSLALLTVDTNPSLQLIPPPPKIPLNVSSVFYTTPVSTPQPSMVSPDQSGNNPPTPLGATSSGMGVTTPGGPDSNNPNAANPNDAAADADSTLIDTTDTTWGVVSSHRLNNSSSLTELNAAFASGYLVKRTGPSVEDAPCAMEINVVHVHHQGLAGSGGQPWMSEGLLREMLVYFRGLGALARARGVVEGTADVRPWHVAVVEKCVRALYLLM